MINNAMYGSEFTDHEIKEQLKQLGFKHISQEKFNQFKRDLEKLITSEITLNSTANCSSTFSPVQRNHHRGHGVDDEEEASDQDDPANESFISITTTSSVIDNKVLKRKTVRKTSKPIESNHKKNQDDDILANRMRDIRLNEKKRVDAFENTRDNDQIYNESYDEEDQSPRNYHSSAERLYQLNEQYAPVEYPLKSFIRSQSMTSLRDKSLYQQSVSGQSGYVKANPVHKYQQYQRAWSKFKAPGEKNHNNLRWSIRAQMLEKHVIVKRPHKTHKPNDYVVPTEKKRSSLRWMVRSALANPS